MKKQYHIKVLGEDIAVLSDSGDEHVETVVNYVNERVREIQVTGRTINTLHIAILAALNIADEYQKIKGIKEDICHQMESRSEKLIHLINEIRK